MGPLRFEPGVMIWSVITFLCLITVLARFAFRPLRNALEEREKMIRDSLQKAQQAREEAEQILARNAEQLDRAQDEARRIIDEGQRIVAEMKREAREAAKLEAAQIVNQARTEIDREVAHSLVHLKATLANLALQITRQVLKENIGPQQHERLADEFIERLRKVHAERRL
ncbi:MAG: F0F1 ATP synthase subunit B [Kiritimatiellia bacterium]